MVTKFTELEEDAQDEIMDDLSNKSRMIGFNSWDAISDVNKIKHLEETYGLCASCKFFRYCRQEYGGVTANKIAHCAKFDKNNKGIAPVVQCNEFDDRNGVSLQDMKPMAYILDMGSGKEMGFHAYRTKAKTHIKSIERERKAKELKRNKRLGII
jgi:hypothetical protein